MAKGLSAKVGAFVDGSANFLKAMGLPASASVALMGVLVASFAGTTLDTACRLQRYVVQELASVLTGRSYYESTVTKNPLTWLQNKHGATIFAIVVALMMAALPAPDKVWTWKTAGGGGLILWPMFGATNQLLGGLALLVLSFWLWRRKLPVWLALLPMLFMLLMPAWAMLSQMPVWISKGRWVLVGVAVSTMLLEVWMIVEAVLLWPSAKGVLEESLPPLNSSSHPSS
jgi:carbon starvation protein